MADEASFIELVIASERVGKWMDIIQEPPSHARLVSAVRELEEAVASSEAYAEEAVAAGAVPELLKLLRSDSVNSDPAHDSTFMDSISHIIGICCGDNAVCGKVSHFDYGEVSISVKEGALGQGLGAKMWEVAHIINKYLHNHPDLVAGRTVLEIGSGCGSTGILAAKLGAEKVFLTDCVPSVLRNLRSCVMMNYQPSTIAPDIDGLSDASTASDLDFGDLSIQDFPEKGEWDMGNMCVRYLDWSESITNGPSTIANSPLDCTQPLTDEFKSDRLVEECAQELPECLNSGEVFDVVLGADVLYEVEHAGLVAAVVSHRLAKHGRCLVIGAIREQAIYDEFFASCKRNGLRVQYEHIATPEESRYREYEGGIVMIALDWEIYPGWTDSAWKPE